jgi:two-component system chemotaxis response regulator CheY
MAHILIVDDDKALRSFVRAVLLRAGHDVTEAEDGRRGEAAVALQMPDLVITDLVMPEEGIGLIEALRRNYRKDLKILAISGGGRVRVDDLLDLAKRRGANATLTKPFLPEMLMEKVHALLSPAPETA